ncbi:cobalamin B12-binding domain-containing protein [Desulfolutivibrio sulfoxidireducens]|uniref:cobalamin B12-binding domain-containing protein n=1 Tax=Desulfolutivibrio sulfoxidireducens TaxID=2773299 RepID=UPI00159E0ABB|nr:B12-binding domain-containing protein [Desulfolutivibrio sulfoxidireducens]QLA19996.1 methanol--cobalamin methyltransferase [Desulfolutivibrio sulfoxidireducens]
MKVPSVDVSTIFTRYDLDLEVARQKARTVSQDVLLQRVAECVVTGDEEGVEAAVLEALKSKQPLEVIDSGMIPGMREVSRLWELGTYFLPQVILSSDAMIAGIALCERELGRAVLKKAKVVTHTAEGDIHDIGQVIVNALLNAAGFEVVNLGADVPVETVIEACVVHKPVLVTGTALMTTTMTAFPKIAAKLKQAGISIPFVCGGGAVSEEFVTSFDQGIWGKEAGQAPAMAEDALRGLDWKAMRAKWNG